MSESQQNRGRRNGGENRGGGRGRNGGGGRGGGGGKNNNRNRDRDNYQEYQEPAQKKEVIVTQKIEMNADDWKSMFGGGTSENYDNQSKEVEQAKKDQEKEIQDKKKKEQQDKEKQQQAENKTKADKNKKEEESKQAADKSKTNEDNSEENKNEPKTDEEEKKEESKDKKKKSNIVVPPKDFNFNNLESLWADTGKIDKNKKEMIYEPIITNSKGKDFNNLDINLKLTETIPFSMTHFDKVNKGLANQNINCFMNVTLQTLIACPAFFNMLTAISENEDGYKDIIANREVFRKFVELSRHFEPKVQLQQITEYKRNIVDAQQIFYKELNMFNPEQCQQDQSEFMTLILDMLHEEIKNIYVPQEEPESPSPSKVVKKQNDGDWNETAKQKINFSNKDSYMLNYEPSIVRDIFGGVIRKEFHVEGHRSSTVSFEPNFILQLDIIHEECTIEQCLDKYFEDDPVEGYKMNNKVVRATNRFQFEKLPNILMLNLKRFIWTDRLVKKKEHVFFEPTLEIQDNHVSQHLEIGIFKKASQKKSHRKYRLYSIIEHIGNTGQKGHYVCYTLDSNNDWIKFNDKKWSKKDLKDIQDEVQAYMLCYELIQE